VLGVLSYYTLFLTDVPWFKEAHELVVHFDQAGGLRQGDSVLVAGIRQGRVMTLSYDPTAVLQRRVTVLLYLDQDVALREGFTIEIEDATLLGGKQVAIDPGPPEGREVPGDTTLAELERRADQDYVPATSVACLHAALGNGAAALRWLERAREERCHFLIYLSADPLAAGMLADPDARKLLEGVHLSQPR